MIRRLLILFLLLNTHGLTLGQGQSNNGTEPSTTTATTTTSSTTTEVPKTTPSTTTEKPTTTTPTTTTTPSTTPVTTPTTATPVTTPAPAPAPTPAPPIPDKFPKNIGNWTVVDSTTNVTCILFKGALDVVVTVADRETNKTSKVEVYVPAKGENKAVATGSCGQLEQEMILRWTVESNENVLSFSFVLNKTDNSTTTMSKYHLDKITGAVYPINKNASESVKFTMENLAAHPVPMLKSYKCNSEEVLKTKGSEGVEIKVANVQIEAFRNSTDATKYGAADECAADGYVADIVPIAVGCSLAGLVIIVLIAYLFGRRRARARGYQSV